MGAMCNVKKIDLSLDIMGFLTILDTKLNKSIHEKSRLLCTIYYIIQNKDLKRRGYNGSRKSWNNINTCND